MENFEQFRIENQEIIFGGELLGTFCGREFCDIYDTKNNRIVYL